ncbi:MAG TPA: integrase family protein [Rhizomicrobium sp.]|nr:integrase family protein [Rhizomicrobium sp.]
MIETYNGMPFEDTDPALAVQIERLLQDSPFKRRKPWFGVRVMLTDALVQAAICDGSEAWVMDQANPALALRLRPTGGKSWYYLYDKDEGARREYLGSVADYTVEEARKKAEWAAGEYGFVRPPPRLRGDMRVAAIVAQYFDEHPPDASDWFKTVQSLFDRYLLPRFGTEFLSVVRKDRWLLLIEKAALEQRSRGANLHKALRAFLSWSVKRGVLHANPLAKTVLDLPSKREGVRFRMDDLCAIYEAAQTLGHPWAAMVGLAILTREAIEEVRQIRGTDIDWKTGIWRVDPPITLTPEMRNFLEPYRLAKGYFFQSPRVLHPRPINFYREILERLRTISGIPGTWTMRDVRRATFYMQSNGREWSLFFAAELARWRRERAGVYDVEI